MIGSKPAERVRVAIVGAGLSGVLAAHRLQAGGVHDLALLEARDQPGGRVLSVSEGGFDLGATWLWPTMQPRIKALIDELGLSTFDQPDHGAQVWERSLAQPPVRVPGLPSAPPAQRLHGGMARLVGALVERLTPGALRLGHVVQRVSLSHADGPVLLECRAADEGADGRGVNTASHRLLHADHVLVALPPRLVACAIDWSPALPAELVQSWRGCDTWMAPHAKYLAVYGEPFWRGQGLSGGARSAMGPMAEVHDASMPGGKAALFGFIAVPAITRERIEVADLQRHCRAQLVRLFGQSAASPLEEHIKDWAQDPFTATSEDSRQGGGHPVPGLPTVADLGPWRHRMTGIGSEWSREFPGYLAGAIDAAQAGVAHILSAQR